MAQWTLTDNSTGTPDILTFEWNPRGFTPPGRSSTITSEASTAPNGQRIYFQGRDQMVTASFEGAVGSQTFFQALNTWKDKHYPLVLADDQGNTWTVIFQEFKWTRIKRRNPWRHDYTAVVVVL